MLFKRKPGRPKVFEEGVTLPCFRVTGMMAEKLQSIGVACGLTHPEHMRHIVDRYLSERENDPANVFDVPLEDGLLY